ncbi:MAG: hypothetical protein EBV03_13435, partial [Proteobacteria bacterium]|nr:hypothetical protein [Pseudomonadota bacterium]
MTTLSWVRRVALLGLASSLTSGCIMYRLEELRHTTPQGSAFQTELSRMYMDFATQEEKLYDWRDSWYFADKGLMLAYGKDVGPEELDQWDIPADLEEEAAKTRIRVMDALSPQMKQANPSTAAAIQFYFDCWLEQVDERAAADEVDFCHDGLMQALGGSATRIASMPVKAPVRKAEPKPIPAHEDMAREPEAEQEPVKINSISPAKPAPKPDAIPFGGFGFFGRRVGRGAAKPEAKAEPEKPKAPAKAPTAE